MIGNKKVVGGPARDLVKGRVEIFSSALCSEKYYPTLTRHGKYNERWVVRRSSPDHP